MKWDFLRRVEEMEKAEAELIEEEADWKGKTKPQSYTG
jgi:hypothetical protein